MSQAIRYKTNQSYINSSFESLDTSHDQSALQKFQTSSKKFTRKKDSNQSFQSRLSKSFKTKEDCFSKYSDKNNEKKESSTTSEAFIRPQDLFLKLDSNKMMFRTYIPNISSQRSSSKISSQRKPKINLFNGSKTTQKILKTQIELTKNLQAEIEIKNNQILMMEDQNIKLKRQINSKEQEFIKRNIKYQQQHTQLQQKIDSLNRKVKEKEEQLNRRVRQKEEKIKNFKMNEKKMIREIKEANYAKLLVEKQLDQIYKRKLPKDLKDLISYRQVSLQKQVQEMKSSINMSKQQKEILLQKQIQIIKQLNLEVNKKSRNLQVCNRTLTKKMQLIESHLLNNIQVLNKKYSMLKITNQDINNQMKKMRKENMKLKQLNAFKHCLSKRKNSCDDDSVDSLSFSLEK